MILILLSWILMLFFFIPTGIALINFCKIQTNSLSFIILLGMFVQCILLTIFSFFINIGIEVFITNCIICSILLFANNKKIIAFLLLTKNNFAQLNIYSKSILFITIISSLYFSAKAPFLIDNESYYIQTIKWINEYGLVKGLANLHIFFAQCSPFHVLQAGFNFSFLSNNFNDLNGFILVVSSCFFIQKAEQKFLESTSFHWVGLVPVFNILFFQFISQPSPDFIIIIVCQIIFYLFLEETANNNALFIAIFLFLFLFFVKITIAPIALLLLYWIVVQKRFLGVTIFSGSFLLAILISKNLIISGYPFYPFNFFSSNFDWTIPENLFLFITDSTKNTGYFENKIVYNASFFEKIIAWIQLSGLNRFFNLGIILLLVSTLFTTLFVRNNKFKILYLVLLFHFLIVLGTSPQYRFFLPQFVFFMVVIGSNILSFFKFKFYKLRFILIVFLVSSTILIEIIDFKKLSPNVLMHEKSKFTAKNLLVPKSNSKYAFVTFKKIKNGNLIYYSPKENFFFFGTANGHLPCVNKMQIDYFEKYYKIKPQLRTTTIQDGFYSKSLKSIR